LTAESAWNKTGGVEGFAFPPPDSFHYIETDRMRTEEINRDGQDRQDEEQKRFELSNLKFQILTS
jgi:hypothetical protein